MPQDVQRMGIQVSASARPDSGVDSNRARVEE